MAAHQQNNKNFARTSEPDSVDFADINGFDLDMLFEGHSDACVFAGRDADIARSERLADGGMS